MRISFNREGGSVMIQKVIKETMELLIDGKGFFLEEFPSTEEDLQFYLYTTIRNGYLAVIFSRLGEEEKNHLAFLNHARGKNMPVYILNIIFTDDLPVPLKNHMPNYSEVYVNGDGEFFGHDDVSLSVLSKKNTAVKKFSAKAMKATLTLVLINVVVYLLTALASGSFDIRIDVLIRYGAKVNELIVEGELYRLLSSAFLHGDFTHILFNMYALFALGKIVEEAMGTGRFLLVYFISALGGGVMSFLFTPNVSVGASGAIFGLLGAVMMMALLGKSGVNRRMFPRILLLLFINLFSGFSSSTIDNFGHIGGLLAGILVSFAILQFFSDKTEEDRPPFL